MSSGSLVFTNRSSSDASSRGNGNDDRDGNNNDGSGDNRLAPYNPTHATAQSKALDLLKLTPRDVFFDLGCGDGRLIVAALEKCYDDDFLMRVHRERFAKLQLDFQGQQQGAFPPPSVNSQGEHVREQSQNSVDRSGRSGSTRRVHHSRSHSDYSIPHMMRTSSDASDLDVSENSTPYKIQRGENVSQNRSNGNESGSVDVLSALSPMSSQQGMGTLPNSPVTPIASNLRLRVGLVPPAMPSSAKHKTPVEDEPDIPLTIETPTSDGKGGSGHAPQISELPTYESLLALQDSLATVPSGSSMHDEDGEGFEGGGSDVKLGWTPYDAEIEARDGVAGGNEALGDVSDGAGGAGSMGGGLRCVGIEYNQALAENAESNVQKSYIYPHVENKVCIRWGDVLEEWNRGRGEGFTGDKYDGVHQGNNEFRGARVMGDLQHCALVSRETCDGGDDNARNLTLLEDATAVFVYLLPQGLKKVKPLLREAAVRRRRMQEERQREREQERQRQQQQQKWEQQQRKQLQQLEQHYPDLYHPLQQQSLHETGPVSALTMLQETGHVSALTMDETLETLSPPPRQILHRKDFSHVSDITNIDFLSARTGSSVRVSSNSNNGMVNIREAMADVAERATEEEEAALTEDDPNVPSFRVVSYMFSVPGWTATSVDRGSKGGCPLYLYENVHEEAG